MIAFERGSGKSHSLKQYTCHWQSICYHATLRINIWLRGIFCKPGSLSAMKKQDECAFMQILPEFGTL